MVCERCEREIIDAALIAIRENKVNLKMGLIAEAICEEFNVSLEQLRGEHRTLHIAFIRQIFMYFCRRLTDRSFPAIGLYLNRDHSTCIHGNNLIGNRRLRDKAFHRLLIKVEGQIREKAGCPSNSTLTKSPGDSLPITA